MQRTDVRRRYRGHWKRIDRLRPLVGVSLLAQNLYPALSDQADWHFAMRDGRRPAIQFSDGLQLHVVELDKADGLPGLSPALRAWVSCLCHNLDDALMDQITYPPVREALRHLEDMSADEELRLLALQREIALLDERMALQEAREEGLQEGKQEGLRRQAAMLEHLMQHRFGTVSPQVRARLAAASADQLEAWAVRLLDADTPDAVFD